MSDEQKYLPALRTYWKQHQMFPSVARIAQVIGLASTGSTFQVLKRLTEAGYIHRVEGRIVPTKKFFSRPLAGPVRAGLPDVASQEPPDVVTIDDYLIDDPNRTVLVPIRGDSMEDAGLRDGDLAVVETHTPTSPGDIVVALVDGERTVKYLRRKQGKYFLEAANAANAYPPIIPSASLEILGVVIGLVRRYRR